MATDDETKRGPARAKKTPSKDQKKRPAAAAAPSKPAAKGEPEATARSAEEPEGEGGGALVVRGGETASLDGPAQRDAERAEAPGEGSGDAQSEAPANLGTDRYVLAGFFVAAMVGAYVLGKIVHGVWAYVSNRDWFAQTLPALAAVPDDDKTTIGMIIGGIVAAVTVYRAYKHPDVRTWSDEVATELSKVNWPTRKDVTNSTLVVIAASTVATVYLALLDRLWAFITNLVYGTGS